MRSKTRLSRMHYTMASMLRFFAVEPFFSQAENIQDPKTGFILILDMTHPP